MSLTKSTAIKQQTGKIAQMNETCRQDRIVPNPITTKVPKLFELIVTVVIIPRNADSLEFKKALKEMSSNF